MTCSAGDICYYLRQYWEMGPADLVGVLDTRVLTGRGEGGAACAGARLGLPPSTPAPTPGLGVTTTPVPLFFALLLSSL